MKTIPVLPADQRLRAVYLEDVELPSAYMEDFSVLGLVVDSVEKAEKLLVAHGYRVVHRSCGLELCGLAAGELVTVVTLLDGAGIQVQYGDVADTPVPGVIGCWDPGWVHQLGGDGDWKRKRGRKEEEEFRPQAAGRSCHSSFYSVTASVG